MKDKKPDIPQVNHSDYFYNLPEEKIASFPLPERDNAKLCLYNKGEITHENFKNIDKLLPANSQLFFNNTKVIPARLYFFRSTGAKIEIFLLQPESPHKIISQAMQQTGSCVWACMIGNLKKWKKEESLERDLIIGDQTVTLKAVLEDEANKLIKFEWNNEKIRFVDIIEAAGLVPLPPYIKREQTEEDKPRYQTVYSKNEGAVAAPTAGLHFTESVIDQLQAKGFTLDYLTLHVSAGTFQPIKEENVVNHAMHSEQIIVNQTNIRNLLSGKSTIAVGTTSMRTLESLYWYGVKIIKEGNTTFEIDKLCAWQFAEEDLPSTTDSLQAILSFMEKENLKEIIGSTEIMIFPGYQFKICKGLITNFHMPGTTLILLIAAFIGEDWKKVYEEALQNNYRFLSFGDSSLLLP